MFDEHYQVAIADTPEARRIHHQIRYAVYCLEAGYEDPADYPDGEERDPWDEHAVPFLVRHRGSGEWVAAMRLVVPVGAELPIHGVSRVPVRPELHGRVAEVSRLCVRGEHRRRQPRALSSEQKRGARAQLFHRRGAESGDCPAVTVDPPDSLARAPHEIRPGPGGRIPAGGAVILPGLLRAALEYSRDHDIGYWYFLISPALERMIRYMQVDLQRVGDACHHRGLRYPHLAELPALVFSTAARSRKMARFLSDGEPYQRFSELEPRWAESGVGKGCYAA